MKGRGNPPFKFQFIGLFVCTRPSPRIYEGSEAMLNL